MKKCVHVASVVIGGLILVLGVLLQQAVFPAYVRHEIIKAKQLLNGSEALERWKTLPVPIEYKVYMFNVTNPWEVNEGFLPIVKEMGPYVYDEYIYKEHLHYTENTVTYYLRKVYVFNQKKSGCRSDDDLVTSLNIALMGSVTMVEQIFRPALGFLNAAIPYMYPGIKHAFWTVKVKDLLFDGVKLSCAHEKTKVICDGLDGSEIPNTLRKLDSGDYAASFFYHKNNTLSGPFVEDRGIHNISNLGQILSYKGKTQLDAWQPNSSCNEIRGTDSSIYHPFFSKQDSIYIFEPDICASLAAVYEEDIQTDKLKVLRFINSPENFGDPNEYETNKCRCQFDKNKKINCLKPGVMDLSNCQGVPVITSPPHFYLADQSYKNYVEGLSPNKAEHETYIDIDPETGVPIEGHKRLQLNMFLRKHLRIDWLTKVTTGLFPILWIDEGVKLNGESLQKLYDFHHSVNMINWFAIAIIIIGCILLIISIIYFIYAEKILCFKNCTTNRVLHLTKAAEATQTNVHSEHCQVPGGGLHLQFLSNDYPHLATKTPNSISS